MMPTIFSDDWKEVIVTLQESANRIFLLNKLIRFSCLPEYDGKLIHDLIFQQKGLPEDFDLLGNAERLLFYADDIMCFYTDLGLDYVEREDYEKLEQIIKQNSFSSEAERFIERYCIPVSKLEEPDYYFFHKNFLQNGDYFPGLAFDVLRFMKYDEFLKTNYWRSISRYVREERGECELCGAKEKLHVHHKTYEHHGFEHQHLEDLQCLCHECHLKVHHELNKKK